MDTSKGYDIEGLLTDQKLEEEGVWFPFLNGSRLKVARAGNEHYTELMASKFKSNRAVLEQNDSLARKVSVDLMVEVYAHTILKDVEGIKLGGSLITKYTPAIGMKLLSIKDFRERVKDMAEQMEAFQAKAEADAVNA